MKYYELEQRIMFGEEFLILYKNSEYWISQNDNGYYFTRVYDSYSQSFSTVKELLQYAKINNRVLLKDIIEGLDKCMVYNEEDDL